MVKAHLLLLSLFFILSVKSTAQCLIPPAPPDCLGTEPLVTDNENIATGTTKWFYGATTILGDLTLSGGTLIVCGDLTINRFYFTSGTIFIRPGARFVIGSGLGSGLILTGNCAIYNYGTCEIQRNLSFDNGHLPTPIPNIIVNATPSSIFKMSSQYLVVNNANSWFVNNGKAEFWGIISDPLAQVSSVCLGPESTTAMAVLINKVNDVFNVPVGSACVSVRQYSQFYGRMTASPNLYACLGAGHSSDAGCIAHGCTPNNWGAAQVFTACVDCGTIAVLPLRFQRFELANSTQGIRLSWEFTESVAQGSISIYRSADGISYELLDSTKVYSASDEFTDKKPITGNNYYMIRYSNQNSGFELSSKTVKIITEDLSGMKVYPMPFENTFYVNYSSGEAPEKIILTDITGRNIRIRYTIQEKDQQAIVSIQEKISPGIYIIHVRTKKNFIARTILKR